MTISSTTRFAGPFIGAGTTAIFPFAFKTFSASDLLVATLATATGVISTLALTSDYTVTLNADQDSSPGGSITLVAGDLATGYTLVITTDMAALQGLALTNGGGFYPDVINAALDTLTILVQQLAETLSRALQIPVTDTSAMLLPSALERAGNVVAFDSAGNVLLVPIASGGSTGAVPTAQVATGTVDGTNTDFTFTTGSSTTPVPIVFAGGLGQTPGTDYGAITEVSTGIWKIVFHTAPTDGPVTVWLFL